MGIIRFGRIWSGLVSQALRHTKNDSYLVCSANRRLRQISMVLKIAMWTLGKCKHVPTVWAGSGDGNVTPRSPTPLCIWWQWHLAWGTASIDTSISNNHSNSSCGDGLKSPLSWLHRCDHPDCCGFRFRHRHHKVICGHPVHPQNHCCWLHRRLPLSDANERSSHLHHSDAPHRCISDYSLDRIYTSSQSSFYCFTFIANWLSVCSWFIEQTMQWTHTESPKPSIQAFLCRLTFNLHRIASENAWAVHFRDVV